MVKQLAIITEVLIPSTIARINNELVAGGKQGKIMYSKEKLKAEIIAPHAFLLWFFVFWFFLMYSLKFNSPVNIICLMCFFFFLFFTPGSLVGQLNSVVRLNYLWFYQVEHIRKLLSSS